MRLGIRGGTVANCLAGRRDPGDGIDTNIDAAGLWLGANEEDIVVRV